MALPRVTERQKERERERMNREFEIQKERERKREGDEGPVVSLWWPCSTPVVIS